MRVVYKCKWMILHPPTPCPPTHPTCMRYVKKQSCWKTLMKTRQGRQTWQHPKNNNNSPPRPQGVVPTNNLTMNIYTCIFHHLPRYFFFISSAKNLPFYVLAVFFVAFGVFPKCVLHTCFWKVLAHLEASKNLISLAHWRGSRTWNFNCSSSSSSARFTHFL